MNPSKNKLLELRLRTLEKELALERAKVENLHQAKRNFLANMSHELRTPMNAIIGMTALTLDTPLDKKQKKSLTSVLNSAKALKSLVDSIFALSQLEAGEALLEKHEFDLPQLISGCLEPARKRAHEKGVKLISWFKSVPSFQLVGDPARLRVVINHLLDNAVKFSKKGEIVVELEATDLENQRCETVITITDQGIGIGVEQQETVFESYTQGDATKTRKYGGVGIGLSLCKKSVELMKGEITLDSELGRGTKVVVSLAWPLSTNKGLTPTTVRSVTPSTKTPPKDPLRVLIVEDSKINQNLLSLLFKKKGYSIEQALNGVEAIKAFKNNRFDLILMDLQMPEMNGLEATKAIRKLEKNLNYRTYIIALTGGAENKDKEQCFNAGMDNYLTKPVVTHQLFEIINKNVAATEVINTPLELVQPEGSNDQQIIDITDGIKRWDHSRKAFLKALSGFYRDHFEDRKRLQKAIKEKNYMQIIPWAHNIKGVAGNISAFQLASTARVLEKTLGEPDEEKQALCVKGMEVTLETTLHRVKQLIDEEQAAKLLKDRQKKKISFDQQDVFDSITKMSHALNKGEAVIAEKEVGLLKEYLQESDFGDDLGNLYDQIDSFEFTKALTILDKIKNDLGITD